jgi:hypothetical protein
MIARRGGRLICSSKDGKAAADNRAQFIDCDDLTGADIALLEAVPHLKHLDLRLSRVSPDVLWAVTRLRELEDLDLSSTRIIDAELPILVSMHSLALLNLSYTTVTAPGVASFAHSFTDCALDLRLAGTNLQLCDVKQLTDLPLKGLDLSDTAADNDWLLHLPARLEKLRLARTKVTDVGLNTIVSRFACRLTLLDLSGNEITDDGVKQIRQLKKLEALSLADAKVKGQPGTEAEKRITNDALKELAKLRNLHELHLSGAAITNDGVTDFLANNHGIRALNLRGTPTTGEFGPVPARTCLTQLDLSESLVNKKGLKAIALLAEKTQLSELWLLSTDLSNSAFVAGLKCLKNPMTVYVARSKVTSAGVLDLYAERNSHPHKKAGQMRLHILATQTCIPPPPGLGCVTSQILPLNEFQNAFAQSTKVTIPRISVDLKPNRGLPFK